MDAMPVVHNYSSFKTMVSIWLVTEVLKHHHFVQAGSFDSFSLKRSPLLGSSSPSCGYRTLSVRRPGKPQKMWVLSQCQVQRLYILRKMGQTLACSRYPGGCPSCVRHPQSSAVVLQAHPEVWHLCFRSSCSHFQRWVCEPTGMGLWELSARKMNLGTKKRYWLLGT